MSSSDLPIKLVENITIFKNLLDERINDLQANVNELCEIADHFEAMHRETTIGSLSGSVIGSVGGITAIVDTILAPFTLGASLIITGVGVGVSVAGGVTGAVSNITDMASTSTD